MQTGFQIAVNCEQIEDTVRLLSTLSPNNVSGLVLYALFQKYVMEDEFGAYETSIMYEASPTVESSGSKTPRAPSKSRPSMAKRFSALEEVRP